MNTKIYTITCKHCESKWHVKAETIVHAQHEQYAKEALLNGSFFTRKCSECGSLITFYYPFLYCDPQNKVLIAFSEEKKDWITSLEKVAVYEKYQKRIVYDESNLKELIAIFDNGLNDEGIKNIKKQIKHKYKWLYFENEENDVLWFSTDKGMVGVEKHYYKEEETTFQFVEYK